MSKRRNFRVRALSLAGASACALVAGAVASAGPVMLQNATTTFTQDSFAGAQTIDGLRPTADTGGTGWAIFNPNTPDPSNPETIVWETQSPLGAAGQSFNLDLSMFAGGFASHTIGRYRLAYTTADQSTFADGVDGSGQVGDPSIWTVLTPRAAFSSGDAAYRFQGDGSILMAKQNPNLATDRIIANTGPLAGAITGFRLEAMADSSLQTNGPGRSSNGNIVLREFAVDDAGPAVPANQVILQSGTAVRSQAGFSVDRLFDLAKPLDNAGDTGWANDAEALDNVATFETQQTIAGGGGTQLQFEIFSGGFGTHTLGKFRLSATTADRSMFADGNDQGGTGVGTEPIWVVLDPTSVTSDNAGTTFSEDAGNAVLAGGSPGEYETYTIQATTILANITGFKLEALTDPSLPDSGPGRGSNGNYVVREFSVSLVPEPSTITVLGAVGVLALAVRRRRRICDGLRR